jgi:hypothetical protein
MGIHRKQFENLIGPFQEWPSLLCRRCGLAALEPDITEIASLANAADGEEEPLVIAWRTGFFHGTLSCPRTPCRNIYVVAGEWSRGPDVTAESLDDDPNLAGLEVRHILPALPLMDFPDNVPFNIRSLVDSASSVLLSDPSAAATRIRAAIECLLDEQKTRKTCPNDRRKKLSAHNRILLFSKENRAAADFLMAMKWIGNVGTHERSPLPLSAVLDGTELFARAIELIYDREGQALERRAAAINKRGGRLRSRDLAQTSTAVVFKSSSS